MRLATACVAVAAALTLAACSSAPPPSPRPLPRASEAPASRPAPPPPARVTAPQTPAGRIVDLAYSLIETPYRYAGNDPSGFDCSGLTVYLFDRVGVALPRTAETQARTGRWVAPDELAPGDLVFFGDTRDKPHHVGLVVSTPGTPLSMIHASTSRGVIETEVTASAYWLQRLRFGRRVLPP